MAENEGIQLLFSSGCFSCCKKKLNSQVKDQSLSFSLSETRLAPFVTNLYCGVWPIKCRQGSKRTNQIVSFRRSQHNIIACRPSFKRPQGSKTNILNFAFRKKATYDSV
jgi:hypothetical protein